MKTGEQNQSPTTTPGSIVNPSCESSSENAGPNITGALNNLDKKLGNLTNLLVQIFEQKETSVSSAEEKRSSGNERRVASDVQSGQNQSNRSRKRQNPNDFEPLQGERPIGRNEKSAAPDSETDSDDDSDSPQCKQASRPHTEDEISTYAGDSADEEADLTELSATPRKTDKEKTATLSGDNSKLLDDLAKSLSEEDESTSPNVEPKLADITMKRWGKKLTPEYY